MKFLPIIISNENIEEILQFYKSGKQKLENLSSRLNLMRGF